MNIVNKFLIIKSIYTMKFQKTLINLEKLLIIIYTLALIGMILDANNVLIKYSGIASNLLFWPFLLDLGSFSFLTLILYYLLLLIIPIIGMLIDFDKYLLIHISLLLIIISNITIFMYLMSGFGV